MVCVRTVVCGTEMSQRFSNSSAHSLRRSPKSALARAIEALQPAGRGLALGTGLFFAAGALFGYFVVFPPAFEFFLSYNSDTVTAMPALAEYFGFCIQLLLAFGLIFELPVLAFFLARFGLINARMLKKARGYAYIAAFILAAVLTPPDVVSQLLMAGPLLLLYEISIWVVRVFGRERAGKTPPAKA